MIQWNSIPTYTPTGMFYTPVQTPLAPQQPIFGFGYPTFGTLTTGIYNLPAYTPTPQGISSWSNPFSGWFNFSWPSFSSFSFPNIGNVWGGIKTTASGLYNSAKRTVTSIRHTVINYTGKLADYCAEKGKRLAQAALNGSPRKFLSKCAKYVKNAIARAGLGSYRSGNGCDIADVYKSNGNFKEISAEGVDLKKLPAGCILCYGRGVSGYNSQYGHTEITLGNGKAVSDGVTRNIRPGARILIPV